MPEELRVEVPAEVPAEEFKVRESISRHSIDMQPAAGQLQVVEPEVPLPAAPDAVPSFTDADVVDGGEPVLMATGHKSTEVYRVVIDIGGEALDAVFKPLYPLPNHVAPDEPVTAAMLCERTRHELLLGDVPYTTAQLERHLALECAGKNVASRIVDETMFNVMVPTYKAVFTLPDGQQTFGIVMGKAPGVPLANSCAEHVDLPGARRQITKLQLVHHAIVNIDGHVSNIFIDLDENGIFRSITGIDNDLTFMFACDGPENIANRALQGKGTQMPPVVDTEMREKVLGLDVGRLAARVADHLQPEEVDALIKRIGKLQHHVKRARTIEPGDWGGAEERSLMTPKNSYAAQKVEQLANKGWEK